MFDHTNQLLECNYLLSTLSFFYQIDESKLKTNGEVLYVAQFIYFLHFFRCTENLNNNL